MFYLLLIVGKVHITSPGFSFLLFKKKKKRRQKPFFFFFFLLQLAKNVGNNSFNDIMEGNLPSPSPKPSPSSDM